MYYLRFRKKGRNRRKSEQRVGKEIHYKTMEDKIQSTKIPCCPELLKDNNCDVFFFTRTLNYPFVFRKDLRLVVQLVLGFRLTRCTKGLVLGDPAYTITLLPGEKVKLFTSDRRTTFSYDSSTQLSYRSEQMSEEQYFMKATQSYYSDLENSQSGNSVETDKGHWDFNGSTKGGVDLNPFDPGVSASASSSSNHNSTSTLDYLNRQSSNMQASATQAVNATHRAHSISIGSVDTRTHAEGQAEDQYESSSREFSNENNCHALSYIFYRLNKKQVLKFELVSIDELISFPSNVNNLTASQPVISPDMRKEILAELRIELIAAGILDENGELSKELKKKFDFELQFSLPTAGIQVKGCLDDCNTCEPERERYHKLQNDLLEKQIELLEQSQEYRCCPVAPQVTNV